MRQSAWSLSALLVVVVGCGGPDADRQGVGGKAETTAGGVYVTGRLVDGQGRPAGGDVQLWFNEYDHVNHRPNFVPTSYVDDDPNAVAFRFSRVTPGGYELRLGPDCIVTSFVAHDPGYAEEMLGRLTSTLDDTAVGAKWREKLGDVTAELTAPGVELGDVPVRCRD